MSADEHEIVIEIICTKLPGSKWDERGPICLGIQKADEIENAQSADLDRIMFSPVLRVRRHTDGSAKGRPVFASVRPDRAKWDL